MTGEPIDVLVVDDDYHVASVHVAFVERVTGFRVIAQAHTAEQALAEARRLRPDLVLMDIYLPDGDGLEVVRELIADSEPPAVIVISAARELASVRLAMQLGAVHYLMKPFGFAALAERLTAFRRAREDLSAWPDEATQRDVDRMFGMLRPPAVAAQTAARHLAPTLRAVYDVVAEQPQSVSAADVAAAIGISRATAQRALTQLEQSDVLSLELRYGRTGRPEHRYTVR